jgi:hypothetical protein
MVFCTPDRHNAADMDSLGDYVRHELFFLLLLYAAILLTYG